MKKMKQLNKILKIPISSIEKRKSSNSGYIEGLLKLGEINGDFFEIKQESLYLFNQKSNEVNLLNQGIKLVNGVTRWAESGFAKTPDDTLKERLKICNDCEFWDAKGFKGTGKCTKCGCSTWAKLRMATERCPIGKWESINKEDINEEQKLH
jgi:hypothetical protein